MTAWCGTCQRRTTRYSGGGCRSCAARSGVSPSGRASRSARMRADNPMRREDVARRATESRARSGRGHIPQPCPDGCECGRHADSGGARARWARALPSDHESQAEVGRRVAAEKQEAATTDFIGWYARLRGDLPPDPEVEIPLEGLEEHRAMADSLGVKIVQRATLRRYGLTELEWLEMLAAQGWRCPVCRRRVERFVTDHEHVRGWSKLPPDQRKRYVRGALCIFDNYKVVPSRMTAVEAARMAEYLRAYETRRGA